MEEFGSTFHWPVIFYSCISRINSVQVELGGHKTLDGCSKLSGDLWNQVDMILLREKCAVCSDTQLTVFYVVATYNYFLSCFNLMCDTSLFLTLGTQYFPTLLCTISFCHFALILCKLEDDTMEAQMTRYVALNPCIILHIVIELNNKILWTSWEFDATCFCCWQEYKMSGDGGIKL